MTQEQRRARSSTSRARTSLTLVEASERLGVHYMTAYRYVHTGRLAATKREGVWEVDSGAVESLRRRGAAAPPGRGHTAHALRVPELVERLLAGDEVGAWSVVQAVLAGGTAASALYMEVFVPALRLVGEGWECGGITVAQEHCSTVVMQRLIGRMGPLFRRRGRNRGVVVLGAPEGELHALPTALAADLLRAQGFVVIDLGANVPTDSFVDCVRRLPRVIAVGIAVTTRRRKAQTGRLIGALRDAGVTVPIIAGGAGIDEDDARRLGADHWADGAPRLVELLTERLSAHRPRSSPARRSA